MKKAAARLALSLSLLGIPGIAAAQDPLLVVMQETELEKQGVPVYQVRPDGPMIADALSQGFSGRFLRLYRDAQRFLSRQAGTPPQPAYLLLSDNQGGFPRFGFFLGDEDKLQAGYVDLHRSTPLAGRFGALDQLLPHELAHVIVQQLVGPPPSGGAGQVHAIGVRTDRVTAFQEGFAEHFQVLAVDDPQADPSTGRLADDPAEREWMENRLQGYRREMSAFWSPAARHRLGFPLWFGRCEQALRYYAVKSNTFARAPRIPEWLLGSYSGYLLENILPGTPQSPPRTVAQMLASEGVISALFLRWASHPELREGYQQGGFYAAFGRSRPDVDPLDNVYLKIFRVLHDRKPQDALQLMAAYRETFPEEAAWIDALAAEAFLGKPFPALPPLWLENPDFRVGTTVYDQFRSASRSHRFDLNAASLGDLMTVPGLGRPLAEEIMRRTPYRSLEDLEGRVPGLPAELAQRLRDMATLAQASRKDARESEFEAVSLLSTILMSYLWRAVTVLALAGAAGAALARLTGLSGWGRAAFRSLSSASCGLIAVLLAPAPGGLLALLVPLALFAIPGTVFCLLRSRSPRSSLRVLLAWMAASLPMALLATPI